MSAGLQKSEAHLVEPIMDVEVEIDEGGDVHSVVNELAKRRAKIRAVEASSQGFAIFVLIAYVQGGEAESQPSYQHLRWKDFHASFELSPRV